MQNSSEKILILASNSPRRRELLAEAGVRFEVHAYETDERRLDGETAAHLVQRLSCLKAQAAEAYHPGRVILGADTVVVLDDQILGKPKNMDEAKRFLHDLSGRTHVVLTGVTLIDGHGRADTWLATSHVTFKTLTDKIIDEYFRLTNPLDKAGAYGIQSHGEMLVECVDGLMSNVIGLPVEEVVQRLEKIEW